MEARFRHWKKKMVIATFFLTIVSLYLTILTIPTILTFFQEKKLSFGGGNGLPQIPL